MFPSTSQNANVTHHHRGYGYGVAGVTGTIAAALAANSPVFAMQVAAQGAQSQPGDRFNAYLDRLRLAFTAIAAFTTPITAGRRLAVFRATGGTAAGGTALGVASKDTGAPASQVTAMIAVAGALTGITGIEANPIAQLDLTAFGTAGARAEFLYELAEPANVEEVLLPGQLLVITNPAVMDAVGTWQLAVNECHWHEAKQTDR